MKMRKVCLLVVITAIVSVAGPSQAVTIDLSQHLTNPTFDMAVEWQGAIAEYPYRFMDNRGLLSGPSELGWYTTTGGCFYVHPQAPLTEGWEHSPENMAVMELGGGAVSLYNTGLVDINDGDVVEFSFQYRIGLANASEPAQIDVFLYNGVFLNDYKLSIPGSSMTREWQQANFSLTYSGATVAAGTYIVGIDMFNSVPGRYEQIYVDTFGSVPEPATIAFLSMGALALLRKRK